MTRVLKRAWIPLVLTVVLAASGYMVYRLHGIFGSQANARSDPGIEIVQFNPKVVRYDVFGPAATTANINYWDADANTHQISAAPVPWSYTFNTVYPSVSANIMVQGDGDQIGCRITVDGVVERENKSDGVSAQTFCLVKSA
ncbi:MAG: MmpS family transport accessory protein [Mycobacterium sp.]